MKNIFTAIADGVAWLGKEIAGVATWVPKVIAISKDAKADAETLLPQTVTLFEDVESLTLAVVKDGGAAVASASSLATAILLAAKADGVNITEDVAVVTAFKAFIAEVTAKSTYVDVLTGLGKLVTDYDAFGASAKAAIAKIEADAK